jgi:puromycin-sensitive aminopeptidase
MNRQAALKAMSVVMAGAVLVLCSLWRVDASNLAGKAIPRLPGTVVPVSYKIFIEPDLEKSVFAGSEEIDLQILKPVKTIVLNDAGIKVLEAECQLPDARVPSKLKVGYDREVEQISLQLPQALQPGHCMVSMKFEGTMNDRSKGFFRSSFRDHVGHKHWLAATQMEPTDARRMFPCFDEPQYKATFSISASIDPDGEAISNAPVHKEIFNGKAKRKIVQFDETPRMSTYLVALAIGPFVHTEPIIVNGVPIRIWCNPGKLPLTKFSRELAGKLLTFYEQYFSEPFPAKKLDLIAIPDFSSGAMENLGAIIFREDNVLFDEKKGSIDAKQLVALTVAHEMAHMWFGDLVTMQWWDDLWLNEAFADWMSTKAVDLAYPDWHYWNDFALERQEAMLSDSLQATRPIHFDVDNPDQIDQMFDEITYCKGASVLRMLEEYVGETVFRDGIRDYLQDHSFANATTDDFWASIARQSGKNIPKIVHGWIYEEGFPVVSVSGTNQELTLSQGRFVFERGSGVGEGQERWDIPVSVRSLDDKESSANEVLLTGKEAKIAETTPAPYVVNAGGAGYYRVRYTANVLRSLASKIDKLTVAERAAILSDQLYLAVSGQIPVDDYLKFTASYRNEKDPAVTSVLCTNLEQLNLLIDDASRPAFAAFVRDRLSGAKSFGWTFSPSDSDLVKRQRARTLFMLGTIGENRGTIEEARALIKKYKSDSPVVDAELVDPMVKIVAYNGNEADYQFIESLWQGAQSPECQTSILMALGMFQDPKLIERTLKMCLTDKVRRQDAPDLIAEIMETRAGRTVALDFFQKHILHIAWRFPPMLVRKIVISMNSLATEEQLAEVKHFFQKHPVPSQSRSINKIIEAIDVRVSFRRRNGAELSAWLSNNAKLSASKQAEIDVE